MSRFFQMRQLFNQVRPLQTSAGEGIVVAAVALLMKHSERLYETVSGEKVITLAQCEGQRGPNLHGTQDLYFI